ncbi:MAG: alanine racemase [Marinilabiliales bacterium]|nr:MAG: alanine racemase [Marinilabiliales bacterium]
MTKSSYIQLEADALRKNIAFLKRRYGKRVEISSVVKANAYGHGIEEMIPLLENQGIEHFSVFDFSEAVRVQRSLRKPATIMIMGWISDHDIDNAIERGFEFFIFNQERLKKALSYAKILGKQAKIHLEVETGMNRSGIDSSELTEVVSFILENQKHLKVAGFCTHLAGAESIGNHKRIMYQLKKYKALLKRATEMGLEPGVRHVANSAASLVYPKSRFDMVRVGILQYGFWPSMETFIQYTSDKVNKNDPLDRILSWKSRIMTIKEVKTGEFIGYGISYLAQNNVQTALVPVGYSGGYSRTLSNKGRVLINGHRCGVIGVVNMNMIIVDITNVPNAKVNDEVVLIGKQGDLEIKVKSFSDYSDMLNYEILAHMPDNIERKVIL